MHDSWTGWSWCEHDKLAQNKSPDGGDQGWRIGCCKLPRHQVELVLILVLVLMLLLENWKLLVVLSLDTADDGAPWNDQRQSVDACLQSRIHLENDFYASKLLKSESLFTSPCESSRIQANCLVIDKCMLAVYWGCKLSVPVFMPNHQPPWKVVALACNYAIAPLRGEGR